MDKRKLEKIESDADLEQEARNRPAEPVVTDLNDEPAADAGGDFDDEREDENEAVPSSVLTACHAVQGLHERRAQDWRGAGELSFAHLFSIHRAEFPEAAVHLAWASRAQPRAAARYLALRRYKASPRPA